ncbi:MAG TPA: inositol monophosphatase family protein [Gammaproteobacteria bacterium]|nr:inositol monophosphatase family protein [Gammaproteobacteria bacterium]
MSPFTRTAILAAKAAEAVIERYFRGEFEVRLKQDQSPVTVADIEAEQTIKGLITEAFPEHGFYGEETGHMRPDAEYVWLIDPIDGTKSFVRGMPFFSTQIALLHKEQLILGVSNAPIAGEFAYAERGAGAFLNEQPLRVSDVTVVEQAMLSLGNIKTLAAAPQWARLGELVQRVYRTRGYGDFLHYHMLASGKLDIVLESDVNILDIAALAVIVEEAGGRFTDLTGKLPGPATTTVLAASTPALHEEIRVLLE